MEEEEALVVVMARTVESEALAGFMVALAGVELTVPVRHRMGELV
jgi:hypothetical protein